mgnify:CR=1 FL=1
MMTMYISPYRRLARLSHLMDRLLDESLLENEPVEREMTLAVDVQSDDEGYTIKALVPGLEAEDITTEILNNTVSIRGEFRAEQNEEAKYLLCELPSGRFSRVVTLPTALDPAKAEASLKNGVFTLRVPKAEAHRPKVIKVKAE